MMSIVSGAALILTGGLTKPLMVPGFNWIGSGRVFDIPVPPILMIATYIVLSIVLRRTRFGRFVYAVGGNAEASRLIGLPVERVQMTLYIVSGVSGAVAGTMLAAMLGAAAPNAASPHLLTVIAAIILGGTSLYGGRGSVWGTLLAVLILGTLNNGLTLLDVSSFWQDVTRGIVLMLAVSLDQIRTRALGRLTWSTALPILSPVERHSVADQVAKKILDLVRTGNLKPGDQLPPERDLAQMLQVSRPSLREAMRGLQILGVVKSRQGGGAYISSLDAADLLGPLQFLITLNTQNVHSLYESRVLIDGGIARMAAERLSDADIERLRAIVDVQRKLVGDALGFRVSDLEFHRTIMEATGNPFLVRVSHSLYVLGMEYRRIASETAGRARPVARRSRGDRRRLLRARRRRRREGDGRPHAERPSLDARRHGQAAMSKARIGIIGAGWWAAANHIPVLKADPDCEIVAVNRLGARELAEVQRTFDIPQGFEDYREMLDAVPMDGVVVSSPHVFHYEHAMAALEKGCHVLVEKPLTTTRQGCAGAGGAGEARRGARSSCPMAGISAPGPARHDGSPRVSGGSSTSSCRWRMRSRTCSPGSP